jgi:hypothetical protein
MTAEEIKTLTGKTIILRRKNFIGVNPNYDLEFNVFGVFEKSVMCERGGKNAFVPVKFFLEERADLVTPEGKPVVYLPHWYHF